MKCPRSQLMLNAACGTMDVFPSIVVPLCHVTFLIHVHVTSYVAILLEHFHLPMSECESTYIAIYDSLYARDEYLIERIQCRLPVRDEQYTSDWNEMTVVWHRGRRVASMRVESFIAAYRGISLVFSATKCEHDRVLVTFHYIKPH